jgi:hypothetical protein
MKKNRFIVSSIVLFSVLAIILASCGEDTINTEANLVSIRVAGVSANIPSKITQAAYNDAEFLTEFASTEIVLPDLPSLQGAVVRATVSAGASVSFGTSIVTKPASFSSNNSVNLELYGSLVVRVVSEDKKKTSYYIFDIVLPSNDATINNVTVAGVRTVDVINTTLNSSTLGWNFIDIPALVEIGGSQAANAAVVASAGIANRTFRYAKVSKADLDYNGPDITFTNNNIFTFAHEDHLFIEVTAEDGESKRFYEIIVTVGNSASITSIVIEEQEVGDMGTPANALAGVTRGTALLVVGANIDEINVIVNRADNDARYRIGTGVDNATVGSITWTEKNNPSADDQGLSIDIEDTAPTYL